MTSLFLFTSALVSAYSIGKLIDVALATNTYSYSLIVERAMGKKGRFVLDLMVSLTQFTFTVLGVIFFISTFKVTFDQLLSIDSNPAIYGCIVICIYTPMSWVRNIANFSFTFLLGNLTILLAILYVTVYCCMTMVR